MFRPLPLIASCEPIETTALFAPSAVFDWTVTTAGSGLLPLHWPIAVWPVNELLPDRVTWTGWVGSVL